MPDQELIDETRRRIVSVVRCTYIKRAISAADPDPHLNFWRLILGVLLDMAVLDWCVIFGTDGEETHWKKIVPVADHASFRSGLLSATGLSEDQWRSFWTEMKTYRDNHLSHKGDRSPDDIYPRLDHALTSVTYHYEWLHSNGYLPGWPQSLSAYTVDFSALAQEVANAALTATRDIPERVDSTAG